MRRRKVGAALMGIGLLLGVLPWAGLLKGDTAQISWIAALGLFFMGFMLTVIGR